ncbi:MAG TPA: sugar phosphate isomerase/epimerase [Thermomicrobiales bacterium]|jgi:sugar phosphate isomerase/epimerase|nr:sugar phosphate isomerase/epimerase [Thermomicrobiales bacterium]
MYPSYQIALQLYTIREAMAQDFMGTLGTVAEAGYPAVELAGFGGRSAAEVRTRLDELGMKAMGAHTPMNRATDELDAAIEELQTVGAEYFIVPYLQADQYFRTPDQVRALAAQFNEIGAKVKAAGLRFLYHNHDFEFVPFADGGETMSPYELLITSTDPDSVGFELDVFWVERGGHTAHRLIRSYPNRFPSLHIKDMADNGDDAPVGEGKLSWQPVLEAGEQVGGSRWLVVEQDYPKDPLNDVRTSYANLDAIVRGS